MIEILVSNRQRPLPVDEELLQRAARHVLEQHAVASGQLHIAVLDDAKIQQLNRQHLEHDYPTDVLSFLLEQEGDRLEGEILVSAETAERRAREFNWPYQNELGLYVIHGTLHLVGLDDKQPADAIRMRDAEAEACRWIGLGTPPREADDTCGLGR